MQDLSGGLTRSSWLTRCSMTPRYCMRLVSGDALVAQQLLQAQRLAAQALPHQRDALLERLAARRRGRLPALRALRPGIRLRSLPLQGLQECIRLPGRALMSPVMCLLALYSRRRHTSGTLLQRLAGRCRCHTYLHVFHAQDSNPTGAA